MNQHAGQRTSSRTEYNQEIGINWLVEIFQSYTVNQQILAAVKFGVSQNKVIWRLLNLASPYLCSVRSTYDHVVWGDIY